MNHTPTYELAEREAQIEAALLVLGLSFRDIKERGLAEASGYTDFGSYCLDRWQEHSSITDRLIHDAAVNVLLWPPRARWPGPQRPGPGPDTPLAPDEDPPGEERLVVRGWVPLRKPKGVELPAGQFAPPKESDRER